MDTGFDHTRCWRGPVWAMVNVMIAQALAGHGELGWAVCLRPDTASLICKSGLAEPISPAVGQQRGSKAFS